MSLDPKTIDTLRALLDRLVPGDAFPSASEAHVDTYILLRCEEDATDRKIVSEGLEQLDTASAAALGSPFIELSPADQDAFLMEIEARKHSLVQSGFFTRMVELAAEGYYSDPGNGGNRDAVSWRMIGYDRRMPDQPTAP